MVLRDRDLPGHEQHAERQLFGKDACTCRGDSDYIASAHAEYHVHG